jgi:hypothetical protein
MTKLNELIYRCKSRGTHAGGSGNEKSYKRPSKINPYNIMQEMEHLGDQQSEL